MFLDGFLLLCPCLITEELSQNFELGPRQVNMHGGYVDMGHHKSFLITEYSLDMETETC